MSPTLVAQQALAQLGKQPHFTPRARNRLMIGLLRLMPRKIAIAIAMAGKAMQRAMRKYDGA